MEAPKTLPIRAVQVTTIEEASKQINLLIKEIERCYRLLHIDTSKIEKRLDVGGL
mgnify:CR=1 FL=1